MEETQGIEPPPNGIWEPLPFTLELEFPVPGSAAALGTPSRLHPSTPESSRLPVNNPFDSPDVAVGSGRIETWPYTTSGSSIIPTESLDTFVRRRYLETLFLPDAMYSLPTFASDLIRVKRNPALLPTSTHPLPALIKPLLLPLASIENKYRKQLLPHCARCLSLKTPTDSVDVAAIEQDELRVLETGAAFRRGCQAAETDPAITMGKKWAEALERREVFLQIILILLFIAHAPKDGQAVNDAEPADPAESRKKSKKRKRKESRAERPPWQIVVEDPKTALELLTDRLSIWQAVSDLGIGDGLPAAEASKGKGKAKAKESYSERVRRFFDEVLAKYFLKSHYSFCKNFHLKLFGTTLPSRRKPDGSEAQLSAPPLKKARKSSELLPPTSTFSRASSSRAALSREVRGSSRSAASPPPQTGNAIRRSTSVISTNPPESRRSRSESIDPNPIEPVKRTAALARQPSGKNLFQGREVGLMRRTGSAVLSKGQKERQVETQLQTQKSGGLSMLTRRPSESWRNGSNTLPTSSSIPLVQATPSKPKQQQQAPLRPTGRNPFFRSHPTPIKEESAFVAETPIAPGRHSKAVPPLGSGRLLAFGDLVEEEADDDLGDLMYMTDEDEGNGSPEGGGGVPETPVKG